MGTYWGEIVENKKFLIPVGILLFISYGFSMLNASMSIDDLARELYIEEYGVVGVGRWGFEIWTKVVSTTYFLNPFLDKFLSILFLVVAAILFGNIIYEIKGYQDNIWPYTVFVGCFITFPLFNEIFDYTLANFMLSGNLSIVAALLLFQIKFPINNWKFSALLGLILSLPAASYESAMFAYVTMVWFIVFTRYSQLPIIFQIRKGIPFLVPVGWAVFFRILIGELWKATFQILKIPYGYYGRGATKVNIGDISFWIKSMLKTYIQPALDYWPIGMFLLCSIGFFVYVMKKGVTEKNRNIIFSGSILYVSIFLMSFIQSYAMPYRTANTITLFCSLCMFLFMEYCSHSNYEWCKKAAAIALMFICYRQAVCMYEILSMNLLRSHHEEQILSNIGYRLSTEFERKPVVFIGQYRLGQWVRKIRARYRYIDSNVNSVINWANRSYAGRGILSKCFSYYGYDDIKVIGKDVFTDDEIFIIYKSTIERGTKTFDIYDDGDFLVVYLGRDQKMDKKIKMQKELVR